MKILVTGAAGFVGSHMVEKLVEDGHEVRAMIHYNSANNWGWLEESKVKNSVQVIAGDIRDYDSVFSAVNGVDTIFHLAALIGIPYSYVSPMAYIKTNIEGTYNILQSARTLETPNILITSTSETYGSAQYIPMDELHPMVGQSPYSASKIGADNLAVSYFRSFATPVKIVRPFNIYGPRQSARAIIPSIITQILDGKREIKLGNTSPTRDFTFVKDTVAGFLAISQNEKFNGEYVNIGMGEEISVLDLVNLISELIGEEIKITSDEQRVRPKDSEVDRLFAANKKLTQCTSWQPQFTLKQGLSETINWLKLNHSKYKSDLYNV
ncbi:SDR family NAD(P)-dependent oxidoreductase [Polynucleobacter sp. AP-Melu-500A-A1]|uniref:SDR family NAD(P)-dependent oxidoreductase n=1 Tax=Polynucleobacter sp. AP-Melu-500A-A1 TaxID=2576929 RepID=UPI001C0C99CB|nr:SDR family NAD(P)-dependent oxidoreductase [Polynucleobacter sp. AP-Melu-500A-A1]MBU3630091.1 SDR family NAD(P)-dependent oxidoreductase [Polynucleobacter sp. AP-Melu-500A-A1]